MGSATAMSEIKTIEFDGVTYELPFADLLPALSEEDFRRLVADMAKSAKMGVPIVPIVVTSKGNKIIDGQHRIRAAAELGWASTSLSKQYVKVDGLSEDDLRDLALSYNLTRRQLTTEQKYAAIRARYAVSGKTKSEVAKEMGCGRATVDRALKDVDSPGGTMCPPGHIVPPPEVQYARPDTLHPAEEEAAISSVRGDGAGCPPGHPAPKKSPVRGVDGKSYPAARPNADDVAARADRVVAARAEGKTVAAIAEAEGVSDRTIKADLKRAREKAVGNPLPAVGHPCPGNPADLPGSTVVGGCVLVADVEAPAADDDEEMPQPNWEKFRKPRGAKMDGSPLDAFQKGVWDLSRALGYRRKEPGGELDFRLFRKEADLAAFARDCADLSFRLAGLAKEAETHYRQLIAHNKAWKKPTR